MARRAARTDGNQTGIVDVLRAAGALVAHTHMVGGGYPDLTIAYAGRIALVEVKDGSKSASRRTLTPDEQRFHDAWHGLPVYVVACDDDVLSMLDELRSE